MVHFNVPDMTCGGCAQRIRRAIDNAQLPEGMEVVIDVAARQIQVPTHAQDREIGTIPSHLTGELHGDQRREHDGYPDGPRDEFPKGAIQARGLGHDGRDQFSGVAPEALIQSLA